MTMGLQAHTYDKINLQGVGDVKFSREDADGKTCLIADCLFSLVWSAPWRIAFG